jgi:putative transposase
VSTATPS